MAKVKFTCEYMVRSSPAILYNFLITPSGLAQWFSDTCDINEGIYTFGWGGESFEDAQILEDIENETIRYRWLDSDEDQFFEFNIRKTEVSNDTVLLITDFADEEDIEDQQLLWESQVKMLIQQIGG